MENVEQEFLSVIREYERVIYKVCYLYTTPNATLNDLYQDVVLNLWRAYPKFRRECKVSTWIYRIALNTCISFIRKEKNIPAEAVGSREGSGFLFPDVAMKNGITIGISIADKGPVIPSEIREKAESLISEYDSGEEEFIRKYRRFLMEWISDEHERKNMLKVILKLYKSGADETEILKFIEIAR